MGHMLPPRIKDLCLTIKSRKIRLVAIPKALLLPSRQIKRDNNVTHNKQPVGPDEERAAVVSQRLVLKGRTGALSWAEAVLHRRHKSGPCFLSA